jgi:carboxyl-terminal processing protease
MGIDKALRPFLIAVGVIAVFFAGALFGRHQNDSGTFPGNLFGSNDAKLSSEALDVIHDKYFQNPDDSELENASVGAMVKQLKKKYDDRFSHYFNPKNYARFTELTSGRFSGVGMSVNEVPRGLRVASVFGDSPARDAGIREGDIVTAVNGESIAGEDSDLAVGKIKGEAGTKVTITVVRPPTKQSRNVELTRKELSVPAVEGHMVQVDGVPVAYVRLLTFSDGAHAELKDEIDRLDEKGAEGLVLDLRGNGGGLLQEAVLTSSLFVEDGVIVSTEGRTEPKQSYEAVGDALPERPTVVLINGDTASASEILTSALSDAGLATIVGVKSFGKGSFQQVVGLDNGGALDLTVGEYFTRDGTSINHIGIKPDVPARDRPATRVDEGLRKALSVLGADLSGAGQQNQKQD